MVPIRGGCCIVVQLNRARPGLRDVAHEQAIFTETMIKLRVDGKIETGAIVPDPALNILDLLCRALRILQADEGLRQHRPMKEKGERIFLEDHPLNVFTKIASPLKIHGLDMEPG